MTYYDILWLKQGCPCLSYHVHLRLFCFEVDSTWTRIVCLISFWRASNVGRSKTNSSSLCWRLIPPTDKPFVIFSALSFTFTRYSYLCDVFHFVSNVSFVYRLRKHAIFGKGVIKHSVVKLLYLKIKYKIWSKYDFLWYKSDCVIPESIFHVKC